MIRASLVPAIALALAGPASAQDELPAPGDPRVVPDQVLDEQRGGFLSRDGMQIDIGLEQVTHVNGEEVFRSVLRALEPLDLGAGLSVEAIGQVAALTIGGSDIGTRLTEIDAGAWITAIQNSLDNQRIEHQIIMNLELSNVPMVRTDIARALERQLVDGSLAF